MNVTQKDIAIALKVSLITVSRALNDSGYVSRELKDRILGYAREVNYVPHRASQALVRNRVRRIVVFSSSLPGYFWNDLNTGIEIGAEQIRPFRYEATYHRIPDNSSRAYLAALRREMARGVEAVAFVNQWMFDMDKVISRIERAGIPYIAVNVDAPESRRLCYVGPDYRAGGRLAAEFIGNTLTFKEHSRVLVINTKAVAASNTKEPDLNLHREEGFLALMRERYPHVAIDLNHLPSGASIQSPGRDIGRLLASRRSSVDAVYLIPAYNSEFLPALAKAGMRRVISVVHDLDPLSNDYLSRQILTAVVYQNPILQGYYAVKILERILEEGHPPEVSKVIIEHNLVLESNKNLFRNHYLFAGLIE